MKRDHVAMVARRFFSGIAEQRVVLALFALFVLATSAYLHRVPGLIGDEGFEGQSAFEVLHTPKFSLVGANSYLSTYTDYARVPFITLLGYSALGLRALTFIASLAFFWILWFLLQKQFKAPALFALVFAVFSPIFLSYQRIGWAISLLPLYLVLALFSVERSNGKSAPYHKVLVGLWSGLGLSTHAIFVASLPVIAWAVLVKSAFSPKKLLRWWVALVGFWAGFAIQFSVITLGTDDQDRGQRFAAAFEQNVSELPRALIATVSGSSYVAVYTGTEFPEVLQFLVVLLLTALIVLALSDKRMRPTVLAWLVGLGLHLTALSFVVVHFTIRYLTISSLGFWCLAGVGLGVAVQRLQLSNRLRPIGAFIVAVLLVFVGNALILQPYLANEGSMAPFALGIRNNGSDSLVATHTLVACLTDLKGIVTSNRDPILNRIQYLHYGNPNLLLAGPERLETYHVDYRFPVQKKSADDVCPKAANFLVERVD